MNPCTNPYGHEWVDHDVYLPYDWDAYLPPIPPPVTTYFEGVASTFMRCAWCDEIGYLLQEVSHDAG